MPTVTDVRALCTSLPARWRLRNVRSVDDLTLLNAEHLAAEQRRHQPWSADFDRLGALAALNRAGVFAYDSHCNSWRTWYEERRTAVAAFVTGDVSLWLDRYLKDRPYRMCAHQAYDPRAYGPRPRKGLMVVRSGHHNVFLGDQMTAWQIAVRFPVPRRVRTELVGMWQICIADKNWYPRGLLFRDLTAAASKMVADGVVA